MANQKFKTMNAKVQQTNQKSNLEIFYQGWPHFTGLRIDGNTAIFSLPNPKRADDAYGEANKRINALCLPLTAKRTGVMSNTFIVTENEQSTFERLTEQLAIVHSVESEVCFA
jgi:hypothetical protein